MATTGAINGTVVFLQAKVSGTWTSIGGQLSHTVTLNNQLIDITNKVGSVGYRELLPDAGIQSIDATIDMIFVSQAGYDHIRTKAGTEEQVEFRVLANGAEDSSFTGQIASFADTSENGSALKGTVTIHSTGATAITRFDEYWSSVDLLLNFEDGDDGTEFLDESLTGTTFTAFGNARTVVGQSTQEGVSSLYMNRDTATDYVVSDLAASTYKWMHDLTTPFTLECWVRPQFNDVMGVFSTGGETAANVGISLHVISGNRAVFVVSNGPTAGAEPIFITTSTSVTFNAWSHLAVSFDGTTYRVFVNGTLDQSATPGTAASTSDPHHTVVIGRNNAAAADYYKGFIDVIRLTKGVSRYAASFTAPTEPFPIK